MSLFGLSFVLFYLKLSAGHGFYKNLRNADVDLYNRVAAVEKLCKRLKKKSASVI